MRIKKGLLALGFLVLSGSYGNGCSDYTSQADCANKYDGQNRRCAWVGGKCQVSQQQAIVRVSGTPLINQPNNDACADKKGEACKAEDGCRSVPAKTQNGSNAICMFDPCLKDSKGNVIADANACKNNEKVGNIESTGYSCKFTEGACMKSGSMGTEGGPVS